MLSFRGEGCGALHTEVPEASLDLFYSPDSNLHSDTSESADSTLHPRTADSADSTLHLRTADSADSNLHLNIAYRADSTHHHCIAYRVDSHDTTYRVYLHDTAYRADSLDTAYTLSIVSRRACGVVRAGVLVFQRLRLIQSVAYLFLDPFSFSIKHLNFRYDLF